MDVIGQGPERDPSLGRKPPRGLAWAAAAVLVAGAAVFAVTRGHGGAAPRAAGVTATPGARAPSSPQGTVGRQVLAAPDTALLTCDSAIWAQPEPDWRSDSLRVGPLWLIGGRRLGYARLGYARLGYARLGYARLGRTNQASPGAGTSAGHRGPGRDVQMLVHVDSGPIVVMRAAPGTTPYFEFLNSPASTGDYQGLDGGHGYTFVPCPAGETGPGGGTDFYDVGFSIVPGHTASAEVWTARSARPLWITFTAPTGN